ncbi:hypothetical protein BOTBODRAFT_191346 [Botryobasidium botryosum FD-172 SS1]|uniref:SET domain-containing protein n=1 Tax=Botryobasidium botryosum (strain FD-172 SS1) TaxID=930990 RepID=A0A067M2S0_BOTB1|nr:hypothetical protein BOTBODRAFT_191346 [Botryobasidium botryosum FD-172 SS1]
MTLLEHIHIPIWANATPQYGASFGPGLLKLVLRATFPSFQPRLARNMDLHANLVQHLINSGMPAQEARRLAAQPGLLQAFYQQHQATAGEHPSAHNYSPHEIMRMKRMLESQRAARPSPVVATPRDSLIESVNRKRTILDNNPPRSVSHIKYVGNITHFSQTPLSQLKPILISEMHVPRMHEGFYFLCRIISRPARVVSEITLGVEDPAGQALTVSINNYPNLTFARGDVLDTVFPTGTVLAIRKPTLETSGGCTDAVSFARVESPSDVIFVGLTDPILESVTWKFPAPNNSILRQSAEEWKLRGNRHFKDGQNFASAVAYTKGLEVDPGAYVLVLNRAAAYIRLEYFQAALADATTVLSIETISSDEKKKALYRAAQAEYGLSHYAIALGRFEECRSFSPDGAEMEPWIARCQERIRESTTGVYDWVRIFKEDQAGEIVDAAEFIGPIVVTPSSRNGGRAIVTTRPIKVGELLMVVKPIAISYPYEHEHTEHDLGMNFISTMVDDASSHGVIAKTIAKIAGNPELHHIVTALYAGPSYPLPPAQFPPPPQPDTPKLTSPLKHDINIDANLIEHICTLNDFAIRKLSLEPPPSEPASALYVFPSVINHSCRPNTTWHHFGENMVFLSAADLPVGAELTVSYTMGDTYLCRHRELAKHVTSCNCAECEMDRKDGADACRKRVAILGRTRGDITTARGVIKSVEEARKIVKELDGTHAKTRGAYRPSMCYIRHDLANALARAAGNNDSRWAEVVEEEMRVLEAAGVEIKDEIVSFSPSVGGKKKGHKKASGSTSAAAGTKIDDDNDASLPIGTTTAPTHAADFCTGIMLRIASIFHKQRSLHGAKRWMSAACWLQNAHVSGGKALFLIRFKEVLQQLNLSELAADM